MLRRLRPSSALTALFLLVLSIGPRAASEPALSTDVRSKIDTAVNDVLRSSGAPSASIAIVRDGQLAYAQAYGSARLDPQVAARPTMRYSIGSISKQFTATAVLLLAESGALSLDDPVARWFPGLTRAHDITLRHLLSMTSGYSDYWPQDYVMPPMLQPTTAESIVDRWGKAPLDFEPGTKWQYSNTNYVIAGLIVQKVSGKRTFDLLRERVFAPLGMASVCNVDDQPLPDEDPGRFMRFGLATPRPAPKEGHGWLFAMGDLAMTASDLATWDISMIEQKVLSPASYREMQTEVRLANGVGSGYGLGLALTLANGRRLLSHTGEVSGFTARNDVYPDDRVAIVALTNLDASGASSQIASRLGSLVLGATDTAGAESLDRAKRVFEGLQRGTLDRSLFTENANAYFSEAALHDFASSLGPLGAPQEFAAQGQSLRGGMTFRSYRVRFPSKTLGITTFITSDGRFEQYQVAATE